MVLYCRYMRNKKPKFIELPPITDPKQLSCMKIILQGIVLEQEEKIVNHRKIVIMYEKLIKKIDDKGIYEQRMEVFGR